MTQEPTLFDLYGNKVSWGLTGFIIGFFWALWFFINLPKWEKGNKGHLIVRFRQKACPFPIRYTKYSVCISLYIKLSDKWRRIHMTVENCSVEVFSIQSVEKSFRHRIKSKILAVFETITKRINPKRSKNSLVHCIFHLFRELVLVYTVTGF